MQQMRIFPAHHVVQAALKTVSRLCPGDWQLADRLHRDEQPRTGRQRGMVQSKLVCAYRLARRSSPPVLHTLHRNALLLLLLLVGATRLLLLLLLGATRRPLHLPSTASGRGPGVHAASLPST